MTRVSHPRTQFIRGAQSLIWRMQTLRFGASASAAKRQAQILSILFIMSFALDFKGSEGGTVIQYVMAIVNTLAFALLALQYRLVLPRYGLMAFVFWGWCSFLLVGSVGAFINDVPLGQYIRVIYPYVLFVEGFLVAYWVSRDWRGAETVAHGLVFAAIISFLFTVWCGFHFSGQALQTIRYQILSSLTPFLIVYSGFRLLFLRRRRARSLAILAMCVSITAFSVTRGPLLAVGFTGLMLLVALIWSFFRSSSLSAIRMVLRASIGGVLLFGIFIETFLIIAPETLQRWSQRTFGDAHLATFWTRVAAAVGQWEQLSNNPVGWVVGQGFGHQYQYAQSFASLVYPYVTANTFVQPMWYPGEFMWVTPLYYGGLISGTIAILVLIFSTVYVFRVLVAMIGTRSWDNESIWPLWVGVLGFSTVLGLGFTANPFIIRLSAMFLGLALGVVGGLCPLTPRGNRSQQKKQTI